MITINRFDFPKIWLDLTGHINISVNPFISNQCFLFVEKILCKYLYKCLCGENVLHLKKYISVVGRLILFIMSLTVVFIMSSRILFFQSNIFILILSYNEYFCLECITLNFVLQKIRFSFIKYLQTIPSVIYSTTDE